MKNRLLCSLLAFFLFAPIAAAAELPTGENIRVAIIDTGISTLAIDAVQVEQGYNYLGESTDTEDRLGHGTAIAALLAGSASARVTGIIPQAKLVPLVYQTRGQNGQIERGDQVMIARAVRAAVDVYGCRVINISTGATGQNAQLREAVEYAEEKNVVIVSSAGNDNRENSEVLYYPAAYPTVIGVGSVNQRGRVSEFSQRNKSVMLVATGENIWSASKEGKPLLTKGTSFAAALVTGAAASLLSAHPEMTAAEVRRLLYASAADIQAAGYDFDSGWGTLQMDAALAWAEEGRQFRDVSADAWYFPATCQAVEKGWLTGTTPVTFSPDSPVTRAMLWTILWRREGHTASDSGENWYAEAQKWVQASNISDGSNPDAFMSREQLAVILWRCAGAPAPTTSVAELSAFSDVEEISDYAVVAIGWAVENSILSGMGDGTLDPRGIVTRAQAALIMQHYDELTP